MADERGLLVGLVGPTGSGKSAFALALAERLPVEIVSCDSQAVYRGLDIGTAKPSPEERRRVPHHLVDVAAPWEEFSAARFAELADRSIAEIRARGRIPLLVGGTGLYLRALLHGIFDAPPKDRLLRQALEARARERPTALRRELEEVDPEAAARIEPSDFVRTVRAIEVYRLTGKPITWHHRRQARQRRYRPLLFGLTPPRPELYRRIDKRATAMFDAGLLRETQALARDPRSLPRLHKVMGYREALACLEGRLSFEEAVARVRTEQRRYAKRQLTWFRAMEEVEWLPWPPDPEQVAARIREAIEASTAEAGP